jgi:DHA1 family bicyclomycin/chloramphenicol resistance-like MFS transporter
MDEPASGALVWNLVAQMALGLLAMTICLPSMQEWRSLFATDQAQVQLTFSGYLVAYGALQMVYGPLSDRHGRRRMLLIGLGLAAAASLAAVFITDIRALIAARVLQGAGAAAGMVVGRAAVQDLFQGPQRTRVMAYVGMAMGLCPPLATVIGGQIHAWLGWRANFLLIAVMALALMLAAWRTLPAGTIASNEGHWLREMGRAYARLLREPAFLLNVAILSMAAATFYAFLGGAPLVLGSYGVGPADVGWFIMVPPVSYIAGNFLTSRLIHRKGERRMMALGQIGTLCGIASMLALGLAGVESAFAFSLPLILMGIGHGLLIPPVLAATVGIVPALAGSAAALTGVLQQLLGALGGYAVGWVTHEGQVNLGWLMLAFALCAAVAQAVLHRR